MFTKHSLTLLFHYRQSLTISRPPFATDRWWMKRQWMLNPLVIRERNFSTFWLLGQEMSHLKQCSDQISKLANYRRKWISRLNLKQSLFQSLFNDYPLDATRLDYRLSASFFRLKRMPGEPSVRWTLLGVAKVHFETMLMKLENLHTIVLGRKVGAWSNVTWQL